MPALESVVPEDILTNETEILRGWPKGKFDEAAARKLFQSNRALMLEFGGDVERYFAYLAAESKGGVTTAIPRYVPRS